MTTTYEYQNIATAPVLEDSRFIDNPTPPPDYIEEHFGIVPDIKSSAMVEKSVEYAEWDSDTQILQIIFTNVISADDKTILDTIVTNNS